MMLLIGLEMTVGVINERGGEEKKQSKNRKDLWGQVFLK